MFGLKAALDARREGKRNGKMGTCSALRMSNTTIFESYFHLLMNINKFNTTKEANISDHIRELTTKLPALL